MRHVHLTLPTLAENLALDEALAISAEEGTGGEVLRIWEFERRAVVLGASGRIADDVRVDDCRADGVEIGRRSSGGGTVLIGPGALNFTLVLPIASDPRLSAVDTAQIAVLERAAEAFRSDGVDVRVLGSGDLTIDVRKFSGSAQRRLKNWVMIHASVLYDVSSAEIARYLHPPKRQPAYREGRSHDDFLTNLPMSRAAIVEALRSAWPESDGRTIAPAVEWTSRLVLDKFGRSDWTERL